MDQIRIRIHNIDKTNVGIPIKKRWSKLHFSITVFKFLNDFCDTWGGIQEIMDTGTYVGDLVLTGIAPGGSGLCSNPESLVD